MMALLSILAGGLADRFSPPPPAASACSSGPTALYAVFGTAPVWLDSLQAIFASRILLGVTEAFLMTISTTMIGDYYEDNPTPALYRPANDSRGELGTGTQPPRRCGGRARLAGPLRGVCHQHSTCPSHGALSVGAARLVLGRAERTPAPPSSSNRCGSDCSPGSARSASSSVLYSSSSPSISRICTRRWACILPRPSGWPPDSTVLVS